MPMYTFLHVEQTSVIAYIHCHLSNMNVIPKNSDLSLSCYSDSDPEQDLLWVCLLTITCVFSIPVQGCVNCWNIFTAC